MPLNAQPFILSKYFENVTTNKHVTTLAFNIIHHFLDKHIYQLNKLVTRGKHGVPFAVCILKIRFSTERKKTAVMGLIMKVKYFSPAFEHSSLNRS